MITFKQHITEITQIFTDRDSGKVGFEKVEPPEDESVLDIHMKKLQRAPAYGLGNPDKYDDVNAQDADYDSAHHFMHVPTDLEHYYKVHFPTGEPTLGHYRQGYGQKFDDVRTAINSTWPKQTAGGVVRDRSVEVGHAIYDILDQNLGHFNRAGSLYSHGAVALYSGDQYPHVYAHYSYGDHHFIVKHTHHPRFSERFATEVYSHDRVDSMDKYNTDMTHKPLPIVPPHIPEPEEFQ